MNWDYVEYKITIRGGNPVKLEFRPDPASSDGYYDLPLMERLIDEFKVLGWSYHKKEQILSCIIVESHLLDYSGIIQKTQDYITKLIDEAVRQRRITRALESNK